VDKQSFLTYFITAVFCSSLVSKAVVADRQANPVGHILNRTNQAAKPFVHGGMSVKAMPLPLSNKKPTANLGSRIPRPGTPGHADGFLGTGASKALDLGLFTVVDAPKVVEPAFTSFEFGLADHPFNTRRVDTHNRRGDVSRSRFYRAVGPLFFQINDQTFVCSAALIKRGIIVTAAHCVAEFGSSTFFSDWQFVPALFNDQAPFGIWDVQAAYVMASYLDGTDACTDPGVVCANDIAILVASPQAGSYPGDSTGWLGYGWNGSGFTASNLALLSQLGYTPSHDRGKRMQQTDSQAFVDTNLSNNIVFGGRQTGGSSGGPLIANLGRSARLSGVNVGYEGARNIVVGVVSWGYNDPLIKQQGASPFTSENIVALVDTACAAYPDACKGKK